MRKQKSSPRGSKTAGREPGCCPATGQGTNYSSKDLCGVSPLQNQFEPTEASPIRSNKRMAGVS